MKTVIVVPLSHLNHGLFCISWHIDLCAMYLKTHKCYEKRVKKLWEWSAISHVGVSDLFLKDFTQSPGKGYTSTLWSDRVCHQSWKSLPLFTQKWPFSSCFRFKCRQRKPGRFRKLILQLVLLFSHLLQAVQPRLYQTISVPLECSKCCRIVWSYLFTCLSLCICFSIYLSNLVNIFCVGYWICP